MKFSTDLLYKLDHSYTNLKNTYTNLLNDTIQKGLRNYARRLVREEEEANKMEYISSKYIFDDSLNNFLSESQISEPKRVLALDSSLIDLIRK